MRIEKIESDKRRFLELLLIGDEQESMIERYLDRGELFALYDDGLKSVAVVVELDDISCEIKNIATYPQYQSRGYGRALLGYLFSYYRGRYQSIYVGTGETPSTISFYEKSGFVESHCVENFFLDNYDHPIVEEGLQLIDMVYLKREL